MFFNQHLRAASLVLASMLLAAPVLAQSLQVEHAWARATVPGQQSSGAFMVLTASEDSALVSANSPVTGVTEVHEMKMDGDVMKMRAIDELPLPAGEAVELAPSGYHIMLMDLKQTLEEGSEIPLTLQVRGADGKTTDVALQVPVRPLQSGAGHDHDHDHDAHGDEHDQQH